MRLDKRIKIYGGDMFRPQLNMEDVVSGEGKLVDVYSSDSKLSNDNVVYSEKAVVFVGSPIVYPKMDYLFRPWCRIKSLDDKIIDRLIMDLMFLNPNLSGLGVNRMTSWIVSFFVDTDEDGSKLVTYDQLLPISKRLCGMYRGGDVDIVQVDKLVLYKSNSLLLPDDRRWYSNKFRHEHISGLLGELIHQGAIIASENISSLRKISKSCVVHYTPSDKVKTIKTYNKNVLPKTIRLIEDDNNYRYFSSDITEIKYKEFISIYDNKLPLDYYTDKLSISKRTAVEFKRYFDYGVGFDNEGLQEGLK